MAVRGSQNWIQMSSHSSVTTPSIHHQPWAKLARCTALNKKDFMGSMDRTPSGGRHLGKADARKQEETSTCQPTNCVAVFFLCLCTVDSHV